MQLTIAQQLISEMYEILSENSDDTMLKRYMCNEKNIPDEFWPLHKKFCIAKGNLRIALNQFSEIAENFIETIYKMKDLIERDRANKQGKIVEK